MIRSLTLAVLLLLLLAAPAIAADPAGGPGWYQLTPDVVLTVPFASGGDLLIAGGTPGFLVGVTADGLLRLRFERGIATARGIEITTDGGFGAALTVDVDPTLVRALLRQPLSKVTPATSPPDTGGETAFGGGPVGASGSSAQSVGRHTTVFIDDSTRTEVRRERPRPAPTFFPTVSARPPGRVDLFPPSPIAIAPSPTGGQPRMIALEEHEEWLAKILRSLDEVGARCQTKGYGPGWISICEPRRSTAPVAVLRHSE
jgi:hypothetical protein